MYINYFNAIDTLIKNNLNAIKTVDWFNEQYTRTEVLKAIEYPAVYVEIGNPVFWENGGEKMQYAPTSIILHLASFDIKDEPNDALNLSLDLHKLMQGTALMKDDDQLSSSLVRTASEIITDYDQVKVVKLTYDCTVYDYSAMDNRTEAPQFNLNIEPKS